MFRRTLPALLILALFSCSLIENETESVEPTVREFTNVDEQLVPFFRSFEQEAAIRGISIDLISEGVVGLIEEIHQENIAGQCSYSNIRPNQVTLDLEFWNNSTSNYKEYIVFHELGHCVLNRQHLDSSLSNGACASIMRSGTGNCRDNYNFSNRNYYLDELFSVMK